VTEFSAIFSQPPEYKRGSIDRRPSFYSNHVSARVGELYSEKALFFEPGDQSTAGKGIEGEEFKPVTDHTAREGT
jgi:hypothetical protein